MGGGAGSGSSRAKAPDYLNSNVRPRCRNRPGGLEPEAEHPARAPGGRGPLSVQRVQRQGLVNSSASVAVEGPASPAPLAHLLPFSMPSPHGHLTS